MLSPLDKLQRGFDSSGRPLYATRQHFQFFDAVNLHLGGILVLIQGSWSNAVASAGTHLLAGCIDFRTWNLTAAQREEAVHFGRDLGGTMWYRIPADGFDYHIHNNLLGDAPLTSEAAAQIPQYKAGLNGLANRAPDRDPYRPAVIKNYQFIEDDMFTQADSDRLARVETELLALSTRETTRNQAEIKRDKERFSKLVTALAQQADLLTTLINKTGSDVVTRNQLRMAKSRILTTLKDHPDVTGVDNPSDDAMSEENAR